MSQALQGYTISQRASDLSYSTVQLYIHQIKLLINYIGDIEVEKIDSDLLLQFAAYLRNDYKPVRPNGDIKPLAPSSIRINYLAIKSFFKWADQHLDVGRPDSVLTKPRYKSPEVKPYDHDEVKRMLKACKYNKPTNPSNRKSFTTRRPSVKRDTAMVLLMLDTGLRAGEISRLDIGDVNIDNGELSIKPYGTGRKTKPRTVYLGSKAHKAVWEYVISRVPYQSDHPLFISQNNKRLDRTGIRHLIVRMGDRANVENSYPHRFRHTFAIEFLRNGGDVFTLQRLLGHSSLRMVQQYLAIASADIKQAHKRASPADRWEL